MLDSQVGEGVGILVEVAVACIPGAVDTVLGLAAALVGEGLVLVERSLQARKSITILKLVAARG